MRYVDFAEQLVIHAQEALDRATDDLQTVKKNYEYLLRLCVDSGECGITVTTESKVDSEDTQTK